MTAAGPVSIPGADPASLPAGAVVVALSGGADSAVAAWLATTRCSPVRAVFVDHGWPGSGAMAAASLAVARRLGIPLHVVTVAPTRTETEARVVRLAALEEAAGGDPVVTGHHAGDVAETVLANLLRGSGATGLSGIPAARNPYLRPLLGVPAPTVRATAVALGLPFADDPANADGRHHRNHIRHVVLPALEQAAPGASAALAGSARRLAADDALLERLAAAPLRHDGGAVLVPAGILATAQAPVAARVVRRALRMAHPPYAGSAADVAAVMAAVHGPTAQLGGGLLATREGPFVAIHRAAPVPAARPRSLPVPGRVATGAGVVSAARVVMPAAPPRGRAVAWIDPGIGDLTVTGAVPGDRIDLGEGRSRKAVDVLADAGVPRRRRPGWPVVEAHGKIAWLVGARVGAWARPVATGTEVTELRVT